MESSYITFGDSCKPKFRKSKNIYKKSRGDFPGGPVVKTLPSNAGDTGSIPSWGTKIPHAAGQLNPCATTTEPAF